MRLHYKHCLSPVLIFGYGPFPAMGIEGAALAVGIGQALTLAIYLAVYFVRPIRVHIRRQHTLPGRRMMLKRQYPPGSLALLLLRCHMRMRYQLFFLHLKSDTMERPKS